MKAVGNRTTVVLAGAFNPAILRPQWVAVHGLGHPEGQEFQVEMHAPLGGAGSSRYMFDGLSYSVGFKSIMLHLEESDLAQQDRALEALANVLHQLPHSPVSGLGFNFAFLVEAPTQQLSELLTARGIMADSFPGATEVVARRWGNTIAWEDALVNVDCELAGDHVMIAFNFHYSVSSAASAEQILRAANAFATHQERAVAAASALSGQQLEDEHVNA